VVATLDMAPLARPERRGHSPVTNVDTLTEVGMVRTRTSWHLPIRQDSRLRAWSLPHVIPPTAVPHSRFPARADQLADALWDAVAWAGRDATSGIDPMSRVRALRCRDCLPLLIQGNSAMRRSDRGSPRCVQRILSHEDMVGVPVIARRGFFSRARCSQSPEPLVQRGAAKATWWQRALIGCQVLPSQPRRSLHQAS
jgi:hypothetical protein